MQRPMLREGEKLEKAGHCRRQGGLGAFRVVGRGRERDRDLERWTGGDRQRRRDRHTERKRDARRDTERDIETETERLD